MTPRPSLPRRRTAPARRAAAVLLAAAVLPAFAACKSGPPRPAPEIPTADQRLQAIRDAQSISLQAQRAQEEGNTEKAIDLYRRAVQTNPEYSQAWNNLGRLLLETARPVDAAVAFRKAADAEPSSPEPLYNLGVLWEQQGYLDDAVKHYNDALERNPRYLPALRRIILLDRRMDLGDPLIDERLRRAMLLETDPQYRAIFERHQQTIRERKRYGREPGDS